MGRPQLREERHHAAAKAAHGHVAMPDVGEFVRQALGGRGGACVG
jgi:hypothetical protein